MKINLNTKVIKSKESSIGEVLLLIAILNEINLDTTRSLLIKKGLITATRDELFVPNGWRVSNKGKELLNSIILNSDDSPEPEDRLKTLSLKLKTIFPKGKKEGTRYYWADGSALIVRRLKLFFKKYGDSLKEIYSKEYKEMPLEEFNSFIDAKILKATSAYVKGHNGDYRYMRLLKYFMFKESVGANGEVEGGSELINYMENEDQDDLKEDWTSSIN